MIGTVEVLLLGATARLVLTTAKATAIGAPVATTTMTVLATGRLRAVPWKIIPLLPLAAGTMILTDGTIPLLLTLMPTAGPTTVLLETLRLPLPLLAMVATLAIRIPANMSAAAVAVVTGNSTLFAASCWGLALTVSQIT